MGISVTVTSKGRIAVAAGAVMILWAGLAYQVTRPAGYPDYSRTMVQVAESAHDAARTGQLVAQAQTAGRVTGPFSVAAYDDAAEGLAGAQKKFAGQGPPDDASRRLRDELSPLLAATVVALGDTAEAGNDRAREVAADRLGALAEKFQNFIATYG
jgi:hypothetical protein